MGSPNDWRRTHPTLFVTRRVPLAPPVLLKNYQPPSNSISAKISLRSTITHAAPA